MMTQHILFHLYVTELIFRIYPTTDESLLHLLMVFVLRTKLLFEVFGNVVEKSSGTPLHSKPWIGERLGWLVLYLQIGVFPVVRQPVSILVLLNYFLIQHYLFSILLFRHVVWKDTSLIQQFFCRLQHIHISILPIDISYRGHLQDTEYDVFDILYKPKTPFSDGGLKVYWYLMDSGFLDCFWWMSSATKLMVRMVVVSQVE